MTGEPQAVQDPGTTVISGVLPDRADRLEQAVKKLRTAHFTGQVLPRMFAWLQRYLDLTGEVMTRQALAGFLEESREQAGTVAMYLETYDLCRSGEVSDGEFLWAVDRLRDIASGQATGQALAEGYEILVRGMDRGRDGRVVGPDAARLHVLDRFAAIDAELNQAEAPEGDVNAEEEQILDRYQRTAYARKLAGGNPGVAFGLPSLDSLLGGGLNRGEMALIVGFSSSGKSQPLNAGVLTPGGWKFMGDMRVGDEVMDPEGQVSVVNGVFPQGILPVFRVTFSDGTSCEASSDHLWAVDCRRNVRDRQAERGVRGRQHWEMERLTVTTEQLGQLARTGYRRPRLPRIQPLEFPEGSLPVDPYLLGLLLGDGSFTRGSVVKYFSADPELVEAVRSSIPAADRMTTSPGKDGRLDQHRIVKGSRSAAGHSTVKWALMAMGLFGHASHEKFVPQRYKLASVATRLAVLQGLMDTDGNWAQGAAEFGSASRQLRDDVVWLARSLGLMVTYGERPTSKRRAYRAWIRETEDIRVFRLQRKLGRIPSSRGGRVVRSVEFSRNAECQCLSVSAPSSLYITDGVIPTHNTSLCVQLAWNAKVMQGKNVVFFTSETLRPQVINKVIARHSRHEQYEHETPDGLDSNRIRAGLLSGPEIIQFQAVTHDFTHNQKYGRFYLAQLPFGATIGQVRSRLARIGHLFSVDLCIVDYLGLLNSDRRRDAAHEEAAQMVKDAKGIAATFDNGLGVPMVSPWQVNRPARDKALKEGSYSGIDLAGTQEAFNTSDLVLTLLEPSKIENPRATPVKGELLKNRDGPRGMDLRLTADYATSRFLEGEAAGGGIDWSRVGSGGQDFGTLV